MKIRIKGSFHFFLAFLVAWAAMTSNGMAQKKGGGNRPTNVQKPASRPSAKPAAKPSNIQKPAAKPSNVQKPAARPSSTTNQSAKSKVGDKRDGDGRAGGDGGKFNNNKVNIDNSRGDVNINVDNSKDIKVRNNRNTVVRHNNYRPYTRPPYVYGGYRYRCYHPYFYHPYRPFVWGPVWHPWGFFIATLATTAIIVSFADADIPPVIEMQEVLAQTDQRPATDMAESLALNDQGMLTDSDDGLAGQYLNNNVTPSFAPVSSEFFTPTPGDGDYYFDQGVFYLKEKGGYTVVAAPVGAVIKALPTGYETVVIDETSGVKNYYWGGTFYEKVASGYKVVPPTSGTVVEHISDGGEEVKIGDITYVKLGETYFQPVQLNGKNVYEVVDVEEDK